MFSENPLSRRYDTNQIILQGKTAHTPFWFVKDEMEAVPKVSKVAGVRPVIDVPIVQQFKCCRSATVQRFHSSTVQGRKPRRELPYRDGSSRDPVISMTARYFFVCRRVWRRGRAIIVHNKNLPGRRRIRIRRGLPHTSSAGKTPLLHIKQKN
jgi:hypothetical protein